MRPRARTGVPGLVNDEGRGELLLHRALTHPSAPSDAGRNGTPSHRRGRLAIIYLLTALTVALGAFAASAFAAVTHELEPFSPLEASSSGAVFHDLSAIAIDEATGNVFVTDGLNDGSESEGVVILGGEGGAPVGLAPPYRLSALHFTGNTQEGMVFDNSPSSPSRGTLYVYDHTTEGIKKYRRNAESETYEIVGEISVPGTGDGTGMGIDKEGNVYIGSGASVIEFNAVGAQVAAYDLSETPANVPQQIAIDNAGDLFVQRGVGGVYKFPANGSGRIEPSNHEQVYGEAASGVAYDPATNDVYVVTEGNGVHDARGIEYNAATLAEVTEFGAETFSSRAAQVAVDSFTKRVYVADLQHRNVAVFGPPVVVPTVRASAASPVTGTKATLNGSVDPEGIAITECFFEYGSTSAYGSTAPCEGPVPTNSEVDPVSANIAGLQRGGVTYHFRLAARNANGISRSADKALVTTTTTVTEAATGVGVAVATLNGVVRPEGDQYTGCVFEYKVITDAVYKEAPCSPGAAQIEPDFTAHAVAAALSKLQADSTYEFRLKVTNFEGAAYGGVRRFTTTGAPQISEVRASDATQDSVELQAEIDPSGFGTSYHFEWGPTTSYGHTLPAEFEPYVGNGDEPVLVTGKLTGLGAGGVYHYRVVATSVAGSTTSRDAQAETLDSCDLPEARCLEMVSPREPGPVALVGSVGFAPQEPDIHFQASETPGGLAYLTEIGLPETTANTDILYKGSRASAGWESVQYSPGITELRQRVPYSRVFGLSPNLQCGVLWSTQQLTDDPPARLIAEAGGANLYRRNADDSYTLITSVPPERLEPRGEQEYRLIGMSRDCSHVVFTSAHHYPGVPGAGEIRMYEWDEGEIRTVGRIPGGGEQPVTTTNPADSYGPVSEDGSRVFFAATRLVGGDPGEVGKTGLFVREDGRTTKDVSASETSTPDTEAVFQGATPDGSRVYFLANAGLTAESSAAGTDLYEYNLDSGALSDLSIDHEAGGAEAGGETSGARGSLVGLADDGSRAYFVASGQLVPGHGETLAQNEAGETISLYEYEAATKTVHFVATVSSNKFRLNELVVEEEGLAVSRVSPDGRYLLFESNRDLTGYEAAGASEAYLYDAEGGAESLACVSCRQDGRPSNYVTNQATRLESASGWAYSSLRWDWPQTLVEREGRPLVFFTSHDHLAEGAVEGENNLYEWAHGQVYRVASDLAGATSVKGQEPSGTLLSFAGASADGTDLYFFDAGALNWEDPEARRAAWDARVGGGFVEPAASVSCEPASEASCQGAASPAPSSPSVSSSTFTGPGNLVGPGAAAPPAPSGTKPLTPVQQLAKALKTCRKYKSKSRRLPCERNARRKYGPRPKAKRKSSGKSPIAKAHKGGK